MSVVEIDITECSSLIDQILGRSKTTSDLGSSHVGTHTDANALLKFLHLKIEDEKLKQNFKDVYNIINPPS